MKPYIPIILGTGRQGRESEKVATFLLEKLQTQPIETELVDVRDFLIGRTVPPWEENEILQPWREKAMRASALIIVFPEYNHGYPGELKMFLDALPKAERVKPVLLCSVSSGNFGGVRAADHLLPVLRELRLSALKESLIFPNVGELFKKTSEELAELYDKKINDALNILLTY